MVTMSTLSWFGVWINIIWILLSTKVRSKMLYYESDGGLARALLHFEELGWALTGAGGR